MADQLCGPSNALQNFQKHSSTDRTLQQDRLTNRASPSQGFRSTPGIQAGLINRDFEAFQAGQSLNEPLNQGFAQQGHSFSPQAGSIPWANDFQRMNLGTPPPQLQHVPQQSGQAGWHQEFLRQSQQPGSSQALHQNYNAPFERLSTIVPMQGNYQPMYSGSMIGQQYQNQGQHSQATQQQGPVEAFDEEAFARAFDQAAQSEVAIQEATLSREEVMIDESAESLMERDQTRIGADLIHDPDGRADQHKELQQDPDALARTAAELLQRVSNNHSEKFANSQFLQLMRQLRDKEVTVEGDKIIDVRDSVEHRDCASLNTRDHSTLDLGLAEHDVLLQFDFDAFLHPSDDSTTIPESAWHAAEAMLNINESSAIVMPPSDLHRQSYNLSDFGAGILAGPQQNMSRKMMYRANHSEASKQGSVITE